MESRAVWRTRHDDPRTWLGWVARDGRHWGALILFKGVLLVFGLIGCAVLYGQLVSGGLLIVALVLLVKAFPPAEEGPKPADPSSGRAFSGLVEIRRAQALLGEDLVVATFVDGWLVVEGVRTSFSLRSEDVASTDPKQLPTFLTLSDGTVLRFRLRYDRAGISRADFKEGRVSKPRIATFEEALVRWQEGFSPLGESVLPPNRPHPATVVRTEVETLVALLGLATSLAVLSVYGLGWALLVVFLFPGPSFGGAVHALARLRRLSRVP